MCQTPVGNWNKVATFNFSLLGKIVSLFLGLSINLLDRVSTVEHPVLL